MSHLSSWKRKTKYNSLPLGNEASAVVDSIEQSIDQLRRIDDFIMHDAHIKPLICQTYPEYLRCTQLLPMYIPTYILTLLVCVVLRFSLCCGLHCTKWLYENADNLCTTQALQCDLKGRTPGGKRTQVLAFFECRAFTSANHFRSMSVTWRTLQQSWLAVSTITAEKRKDRKNFKLRFPFRKYVISTVIPSSLFAIVPTVPFCGLWSTAARLHHSAVRDHPLPQYHFAVCDQPLAGSTILRFVVNCCQVVPFRGFVINRGQVAPFCDLWSTGARQCNSDVCDRRLSGSNMSAQGTPTRTLARCTCTWAKNWGVKKNITQEKNLCLPR